VSEVDCEGRMLTTNAGISCLPHHLSTDSEDQVLVADNSNHRILLLKDQLRQTRVLADSKASQNMKLWRPERLYLNQLTSQLYVLHSSRNSEESLPNIITQLSLR